MACGIRPLLEPHRRLALRVIENARVLNGRPRPMGAQECERASSAAWRNHGFFLDLEPDASPSHERGAVTIRPWIRSRGGRQFRSGLCLRCESAEGGEARRAAHRARGVQHRPAGSARGSRRARRMGQIRAEMVVRAAAG